MADTIDRLLTQQPVLRCGITAELEIQKGVKELLVWHAREAHFVVERRHKGKPSHMEHCFRPVANGEDPGQLIEVS